MAAKAAQEAYASVRAESRELTRTKNSRHPLDPVAMAQCFVGPGLLYAWIYQISSGSLRFYNWLAAAALGPAAGFLLCCAATAWARGKLRAVKPARGPVALAVCLWFALILGSVQGDENFHWYVSNMYNYQDSATYTDIAPSTDRGQSYMDAGQVYFQEGSYVAREEMAAFKSANLYCVAPIVGQPIRNQAEDAQPDFSWGSGAAPAPAPAPSAQEGPEGADRRLQKVDILRDANEGDAAGERKEEGAEKGLHMADSRSGADALGECKDFADVKNQALGAAEQEGEEAAPAAAVDEEQEAEKPPGQKHALSAMALEQPPDQPSTRVILHVGCGANTTSEERNALGHHVR